MHYVKKYLNCYLFYSIIRRKLIHDSNMGNLSSNSVSVNRKFKTSVKWKTLSPEFREEFSLKVSIMDLPKLALTVAVFDRDLGNNYLGGLLVLYTKTGGCDWMMKLVFGYPRDLFVLIVTHTST